MTDFAGNVTSTCHMLSSLPDDGDPPAALPHENVSPQTSESWGADEAILPDLWSVNLTTQQMLWLRQLWCISDIECQY